MATRIWFSATDMTVLFNDQVLTLETIDSGFVTTWTRYVEIDKNGKLEIITGDSDIRILTAEVGGDFIDLSSGGSVDININDYPNGIYVDVNNAPPLEEYTYTLNITGFQSGYTLRVNGKTLNTINDLIIKHFVYNGIVYEIASGTTTKAISVIENVDGTVNLTTNSNVAQIAEDSDNIDLIVGSGVNVQVVDIDENTVDLIIN